MLRHIVRHDVGVDSLCVDLERALAQALYARTELFENFCHIINIADVGNVFNNTYILSEDSCGQNSYDCVMLTSPLRGMPPLSTNFSNLFTPI